MSERPNTSPSPGIPDPDPGAVAVEYDPLEPLAPGPVYGLGFEPEMAITEYDPFQES